MQRAHFEHLIAAAANVTGENEFVVIGSQAVLGSSPQAEGELVVSMELDLYPMHAPEKADEIDGAIGDGSQFHQSYGYYAHTSDETTAIPPAGWKQRLIAVAVPPRVGSKQQPVAHCLEPHDLVLAKCVANRERDWVFAEAALRAGIVSAEELCTRTKLLPVAEHRRRSIGQALSVISERLARDQS